MLYKDLGYKLRGILFKVYNELGQGLTRTYITALLEGLRLENITFGSEKRIPVYYGDKKVGSRRVNILIEDKIIIELKTVPFIHQRFRSQIISYLKASKLKFGLLVNFGDKKLEIKRYAN